MDANNFEEQKPTSFKDLSQLAETIPLPVEPEELPKNPEPIENEIIIEKKEQRAERITKEKISQDFIRSYERGRTFFKAINDPNSELGKLTKRLGYIDFGTYTHRYSTGKIEQPIDFLKAYDEKTDWLNKRLAQLELEGKKDMTPQEFLTINGDVILFNDPKSNEPIQVKDLANDPNLAFDFYSMGILGPNNTRRNYELELRRGEEGLKGFSEEALSVMDIATTLEGFKRLGKMNDSKILSSIKLTILTLEKSSSPDAKEKLRNGLNKIKEFTDKTI